MKVHWYLVFSAFIFFSCSEDLVQNDINAKILNAGSEAVDGCGWLIVVSEDLSYKPVELDDKFQVDGMKVRISFKVLDDSYTCGFPSPNSPIFQKIKLRRIKKS